LPIDFFLLLFQIIDYQRPEKIVLSICVIKHRYEAQGITNLIFFILCSTW